MDQSHIFFPRHAHEYKGPVIIIDFGDTKIDSLLGLDGLPKAKPFELQPVVDSIENMINKPVIIIDSIF